MVPQDMPAVFISYLAQLQHGLWLPVAFPACLPGSTAGVEVLTGWQLLNNAHLRGRKDQGMHMLMRNWEMAVLIVLFYTQVVDMRE
jgi:hypothetical protein